MPSFFLENINALADDLTKILFYRIYVFRHSKEPGLENFRKGINVARFAQPRAPNVFLVQTCLYI